ncbi:MAG: tail fiber assembly protein [Providencia alcalifaciens]|jgi:hypothetical protein|nr:tail fiber assembly protein [Providencia alcalifaciens]
MNQYFFDGTGFISESETFSAGIENDLKGVWVSQSTYEEFTKTEKLGFKVVQNFNGFPEWKELEEAELKEKEVYTANKCKIKLINHADKIIAPLQDALDLGIALESEKLQLSAWKKYRVILNRVDTSTAPDIIWPVYP